MLVSNCAIAIIAPGTGLGESFLTWDGSQYVAHGSEGGIQILLQRTSVKSVCCVISFLVSDTWEWRVSVPESEFPIFTYAMRRTYRTLKVLATGGVYLAGRVALHLVKLLQQPQFVRAFTRKGRFKDLMERMPIHIITTRAGSSWSCHIRTAESK